MQWDELLIHATTHTNLKKFYAKKDLQNSGGEIQMWMEE